MLKVSCQAVCIPDNAYQAFDKMLWYGLRTQNGKARAL